MTHPAYLREKAIQLRVEKDLTIDEIAERLAISRQTIFSWVKDIPLRERRSSPGQALGNLAMQQKYRQLRDDAYSQGVAEFDSLCRMPTFRDFVCMYIGEGYKRNRNTVSLCNSDPCVIVLATRWIQHFAANKVSFSVQYHADQDPDELRSYWGALVEVGPAEIRLQRKSNSNQLNRRSWRSEHGVLTVQTGDTLFRARLQAWMDRTRLDWLDSVLDGA